MFFVTRATMLRPSEITQRETLAAAIAELLWKVGEGRRAILAIPEANPVFEASVRFSMDGLTEKVTELENRGCVVSTFLFFQLHLFECTKEEDVKKTLKNHIYFVSTSSAKPSITSSKHLRDFQQKS